MAITYTVAIILPAYNEEQTIADTIRSFFHQLPSAQIVVVNNNSKDNTESVARTTIRDIGANGIVINEIRQGKGNAVRRAFMDIDADIYVMADADMTYPAEQVHELILPVLNNEADMVVGDRHTDGHYSRENKRLLHNFGNKLVQGMVNRLFRANLVDIMSGYRVFNRAFIKTYAILVEGFQLETDVTLHCLDKRMRIIEVPIKYKDRPAGSFSKLNTIKDGLKVIYTIAQILRYYRPLLFFSTTAFLFSFLGFISGYPAISDWFSTGYVEHVPLAILASGLEVMAMLLLAVGLVLDAVAHQNRIEFELKLLDLKRSIRDMP